MRIAGEAAAGGRLARLPLRSARCAPPRPSLPARARGSKGGTARTRFAKLLSSRCWWPSAKYCAQALTASDWDEIQQQTSTRPPITPLLRYSLFGSSLLGRYQSVQPPPLWARVRPAAELVAIGPCTALIIVVVADPLKSAVAAAPVASKRLLYHRIPAL